ncbi:STRESS RESPONSE PROTEIN [Salix viminalis]|uniref:STRESS RESPONSE PROTEIN n=1 Tax=Salix viminalis TaxID=40686 RepID=A0A9Q0ZIW6_SALVM|nr:STRESS RESPONSE PROTEIN [Salix viminalis]
MKNAEGCIVEIIGENNLNHFFVGTQDTDMRKKFQERHARSEKLMKENRLQVMLNSDGEIENMDEETHAERHARTVALAQANGRLRFKLVSKEFQSRDSKDCSKMVITHASNDNKTRVFDISLKDFFYFCNYLNY